MSEKYFISLLVLEFFRAAPTPRSVFKRALFLKPGLYLLKGFFSVLLQIIVLQRFSTLDAVLVEGY